MLHEGISVLWYWPKASTVVIVVVVGVGTVGMGEVVVAHDRGTWMNFRVVAGRVAGVEEGSRMRGW